MGCAQIKSERQPNHNSQVQFQLEEELQPKQVQPIIIPKTLPKNIPLFIQPNSCRRTSDKNMVRFKTDVDSKDSMLSIKKNPIYLRRASSKTQADQNNDLQIKD